MVGRIVTGRNELAARSWAHLQRGRELVRGRLPPRLDVPALLDAVPSVANEIRAAAEGLPERLVDGNLGAALAGHVVGHQHDHPELDVEALLRDVLESAGGRTTAVIDVCRVVAESGSAVYYRRRNCCLRDRVTDRHRCDTCSLRPRHELDEIVDRAITARMAPDDELPGDR